MSELLALPLKTPRPWAKRLGLSVAALLLLAYGLPYSQPLFAALFPALPRPVYLQEPMAALMWQHIGLVLVSSALAVIVATLAGLATTHKTGHAFKPLMETLAGMGQTFPPVAVLAVAVPAVGFGELPALIALSIFGVLPVLQATLAGLASVPTPVIDSARAMGMSPRHILTEVQIPLALPIWLAGVRDEEPGTIFDSIIAGDIPAAIVKETAKVLAFKDINPVAPAHILVIPKDRSGLSGIRKATPDHAEILGLLLVAAGEIANDESLGFGDGARIVINDGTDGGQEVPHLHVHVLGGRKLTWPPG